jgi:DNA-binding NarL/FixJ family response regulator
MATRSTLPTWPLVGRQEELAFAAEVLGRTTPGSLVLAGAPGVGKTRLALEALARAEDAGFATAWATATDSANSIPFGALAHLLPVPEGGGGSLLDILRRAGKTLIERAGGKPLVLGIDDAHLLDGASATLVQRLVADATAFVVVTIRNGEPTPDPIVALWKDGPGEYLELQPLSQGDVARLVARALGGDIDGSSVLGLWDVSGGNVLFLRELIREGLDRGALVCAEGLWRWHGAFAIGARLAELIEGRLGDLSPQERSLLELVAVGEPLAASLLESLATRDVLDALERRGLLTVVQEGRRFQTRLAHPLYGELIRARTPTFPTRVICRQLADAVETTGARRRDDLLRLASWRLQSGGSGAPDLLLAASRRAQASFDPSLSEHLALAAVEAGGGVLARHALAEALRGQGRFEEAEAQLAALEGEATNDHERGMIAEARALNLIWGLDRGLQAEAVISRAEAVIVDATARDQLAALRGMCAYFAGRPRDAINAVSSILGREDVEDSLGVRAALAAAHSLAMAGRADEAIAMVDRWSDGAKRLVDELPQAAARLDAGRVCALELAGRLREAEAAAEEGYRAALAERAHEGSAIFAMLLGAISLVEGRLATAARWLRESAGLLRELDPVGVLPWPLAFLAQAAAQGGDREAAESALEEAESSRWPGTQVFEFDLRLARAWVAAARGEISTARALAVEAADAAEDVGQLAFALLALHDLVRLGEPVTAAPRLEALALSLDGPLAPACAAHAAALAAGDGEALDQAASAFEAIGSFLRAAEAASEASAAHRTAGRASSARASSARARLLLDRCEGADTPALRAAGDADGLTAREQEVVTMAASGLSTRAIAARLTISMRTVENHLQHAYGKLGISGRSQLPSLFGARTAR